MSSRDPNDPLVSLARQRLITMSQEMEALLRDQRGGGIVIEIVRRLKERAAESLAALATCDSEEPKCVRILQNEVKRYDEFFCFLRNIVQEGIACRQEQSAEEREELIDILTQTPEGRQEAVTLGLIVEDQFGD